MRVAAGAARLGPNHAVAGIFVLHDVFFIRGSVEARPAGARIKLGSGIEQRRSAADAAIRARIFRLPILSGEGRLGASLPRDAVLLGSQFLLPLGFTLRYFFCHDSLYLQYCRNESTNLISLCSISLDVRACQKERLPGRLCRVPSLLRPLIYPG